MEQIDLAKYGRSIYAKKDDPRKLDSINLELVGYYAYYSSQMIPLELAEARFWEKHKDMDAEKPKSDTFVRALWKITKEGQEKIMYERVLKTIEKLMSSLRTSINRASQFEVRNL